MAVMTQYTLFIDGHRTEAASGRRYESVDPFLGEPWASAADGDAPDVDAAVAAARRALAGPDPDSGPPPMRRGGQLLSSPARDRHDVRVQVRA